MYGILIDYTCLASNGKTIVFCWIPSHVSICGSERADADYKYEISSKQTDTLRQQVLFG